VTVENLYRFKESRFTTLSHELRVFIYGADVTPWLKGDLSITYGNRDSFNTCTFELSNPRKLWQLSRNNLEGKWHRSAGEYSESEKLKIFEWKNSNDTNPSFNLNVDSTILGQRDEATSGKFKKGPHRLRPTDADKDRRYRLAVNDCIFSRNDPMRVFMKNPYQISNINGEWVEIFCGYVHDHPVTTNYQTGESTVRVSGYCVRQLLTKMRVQMNRVYSQLDPQPLFNRAFFTDFIRPQYATHPFAQTTLERTIKALILGTETPIVGESSKMVNGLGDFRMGNTICYDPANPGNTLEKWHLMTVFGVNKVPWPSGPQDNLWMTTAEMENLGRITIDIPDNYTQGPSGRHLHFLLPIGGTGAGSLVQSTLDSFHVTREWSSRWDIIKDFASKLDFQVTTSPSGDILVEFPLYGFTPHTFTVQGTTDSNQPKVTTFQEQSAAQQAGSSGYTPEAQTAVKEQQAYQAQQQRIAAGYAGDVMSDEALARRNADERLAQEINAGDVPAGLGALFTFELHQIEDTLNDEAEDFPTILQVDGGFAWTEGNITADTEALSNLRAFVYSPVLVSRYGAVTESMNIPFVGQNTGELSGLTDSPVAKRMGKLALIEYMKRLADSSTWDGSVVYRPFLFPNRPVWLKRSARIGLLTSVTQRWSIGKSASTSIATHMLMAERYDPDSPSDIKTKYRLPTGASNTPIDYKNIWRDTAEGTKDSGVITVIGTKNAPDSAANGGDGATGSGKPAPERNATANKNLSGLTDPRLNGPNMYQPFVKAIQEAIKKAAEEGIQVTIKSAFRHAKYQEAMKADPVSYGVARKANGEFVAVAEPWKSCHQYGLAVDIQIAGAGANDPRYQKFADLCGDNIYWGGNYGDYVHYEWATQPAGNTGRQANNIVENRKLQNDPEYYKKVQNTFSAINNAIPITVANPETTQAIRAAGIEQNMGTGTGDTKMAPDCEPAILTKAGTDSIATTTG
jgi:hypothetical protein